MRTNQGFLIGPRYFSQINKLMIPKTKKPKTGTDRNEYLAIRVKLSIKQTKATAKDSH